MNIIIRGNIIIRLLNIEIHTDKLFQYGASVGDLFRLISAENYKLWIQWEDVKEPEEYDMRTPIESRVHLFGIPLAMKQVETK